MGLILWIDQNTFASSLVEKVFKKKDLPFYTLSKIEDFAYLVEDLAPEVIVLDTQTALSDLKNFKDQYLGSAALQKTPFIFLGSDAPLEFIQHIVGKIERPFEPFEIPQKVSMILNQLS